MKKNRLSTFLGKSELGKLRNLLVKVAANAVSFRAGRFGLKTKVVDCSCRYSKIPATVELSNVAGCAVE